MGWGERGAWVWPSIRDSVTVRESKRIRTPGFETDHSQDVALASEWLPRNVANGRPEVQRGAGSHSRRHPPSAGGPEVDPSSPIVRAPSFLTSVPMP